MRFGTNGLSVAEKGKGQNLKAGQPTILLPKKCDFILALSPP
jgi:hypothetical protein